MGLSPFLFSYINNFSLLYFRFLSSGLKDQVLDLYKLRTKIRPERPFLVLILVHFDNCFPRILPFL